MPNKASTESLKEAAVEFENLAHELQKKTLKKSAIKSQNATHESQKKPLQEFQNLTQELKEKSFVNNEILPHIDKLIDNHKDGSGITRQEVRNAYVTLITKINHEGLISDREYKEYNAPQKTKVPQQGLRGKFGFKETAFEKSQFDQDLDSLGFNEENKLESPNIKSLKDKLLYGVMRISQSLELTSLAKFCRKHISSDNLDKIQDLETKLAKIAEKISSNKESAVATHVQSLTSERQMQKGGMNR